MKKSNTKTFAASLLSLFLILGVIGPSSALAAGPARVNLGKAGDFVILAKTGISTTGATAITGDIGVSSYPASSITGFGLIMDSSGAYSTSSLITGKIYAADYAVPTPANMSTAISNMEAAYTDAAGRNQAPIVEYQAGNIGGQTLAPGLYKWGTSVNIQSDVTISGSATDVWIFQIAQNLDIASATKVILAGGAQASNIFWQVGGIATLGTDSSFSGNILSMTKIDMRTGAVLSGRALAQSEVTLQANAVSNPAPATPVVPVVVPEVPVVIKRQTSSGSRPSTTVNYNNNDEKTNDVVKVEVKEVSEVKEDMGCANGSLFSFSSGKACNNNVSTTNVGCSNGSLFSFSTGKACINNVKSIDFGTLVLKVGSHGDYVKALQALVGADVDGSFGPATKSKVMIWQKNHNLDADGIFGNKSKAKAQAI